MPHLSGRRDHALLVTERSVFQAGQLGPEGPVGLSGAQSNPLEDS
jgi:hypothetical protein